MYIVQINEAPEFWYFVILNMLLPQCSKQCIISQIYLLYNSHSRTRAVSSPKEPTSYRVMCSGPSYVLKWSIYIFCQSFEWKAISPYVYLVCGIVCQMVYNHYFLKAFYVCSRIYAQCISNECIRPSSSFALEKDTTRLFYADRCHKYCHRPSCP